MAVKRTPSKKPVRDRSGALYVLLDPAQLAELDDCIARLNTDPLAPQWTRTAIVKALVARWTKGAGARGEAP